MIDGATIVNCRFFITDEPQTNADRIRAMSDEELYKFCMRITHEGWPFACQHRPECNPTPPMPHWCDECFMLWLKEPAEEGE